MKWWKNSTWLMGGLSLLWFFWLVIDPFKALAYFQFFLFFLTAMVVFSTVYVFLKYQQIIQIVRIIILIALLLPLLLLAITLVDPYQLEQSWPLILSLLVFNVIVGILSLTGGFMVKKKGKLIQKLLYSLTTLIAIVAILSILLVLDNSFIFSVLFVLIFIVLVGGFYIISVNKHEQL